MHRVSALLPSWDRSRQPTPAASAASITTPTSPTAISPTTTSPTTTTPISAPKTPRALDKVFGWAGKVAVPASRNSSPAAAATSLAPARYGRETYWPTTLDKECDKAARIIKSFCFDGFLSQEFDHHESNTSASPSTPAYVTKKIPPRIIQNAVGLAVFSCMRSGLWMSGSGGAGLITARKADGTWSPPSAIILHTSELAFVVGVDIYDCVLVINSVQTLELFTRPRLILGTDVSLAVGPLVAAGSKDPEIRWKEINDTVLSYVKARGKHQAVQLDGSLVTERVNENDRFYCAGVTILDILAGNIPKNVPEMRPLFEVIKAAEGRSDYDKALMDWLAQQPAPGDADIASPTSSIASPTKQAFGVPHADDPDPFGVIGLEMAGIEIREAGSKLRPTSTQFEFHPSPTSPVYGRFSRQSMDTFVSRSNRGSCMSARTQATAVTDACTQTDVASTADTSYSRANSDDGKDSVERLSTVVEPDEVDYTQVDTSIIERLKRRTVEVAPPPAIPVEAQTTEVPIEVVTAAEAKEIEQEAVEMVDHAVDPDTALERPSSIAADEQDDDADDEEDDEDEDEEPVICEVATASTQPTRSSIQTPQVTHVIHAKGAIVTIPKRIPPPLPARSPARASRGSKSDYGDVSSLRSPIRNSFLSIASRTSDTHSAADSASINETIAAQEDAAKPETVEGDVLMQRPASPRHHKNSSSVSTAVAIETPAPEQQRTSLSQDEAGNGNEHHGERPSSPAVSPTPQALEPGSSAEDESEREPRTPQMTETAETDFDTASEHQSGEDEESREISDLKETEAVVKMFSPAMTGSEGTGRETLSVT